MTYPSSAILLFLSAVLCGCAETAPAPPKIQFEDRPSSYAPGNYRAGAGTYRKNFDSPEFVQANEAAQERGSSEIAAERAARAEARARERERLTAMGGPGSGAIDPSRLDRFKAAHAGRYVNFTVTYDGMDPANFAREHNYLVVRSAEGYAISVRYPYSGELQTGTGTAKPTLKGTTVSIRFGSSGEPESIKNPSNGKTATVKSWGLE